MFVWSEERKTVILLSAAVGRPAASSSETTAAGKLPFVGSFGGTIVSSTCAGSDGVVSVAANEGNACRARSARTAMTTTRIVLFILGTSKSEQNRVFQS
jgi:hypothetical protein